MTASVVSPSLVVIVGEEELVRATFAAKYPAHAAVSAVVADPLEADGTLPEGGLHLVLLALDAVHGRIRGSIPRG
jgi:hypothetical protein